MRVTAHVLRSPCTVLGSEFFDVGSCTICDDSEPASCKVYPIAAARVSVNFKPMHEPHNVTGHVWYCRAVVGRDPCELQIGSSLVDQFALDAQEFGHLNNPNSPLRCAAGQIFGYMQLRNVSALNGEEKQCYYNSRYPGGEDVWLSMPEPSVFDHLWLQKHTGYPLLVLFGYLVLLSLLLACLTMEGAELWTSGLL
eukprot:CAMPEP_0117460022 /NCGR_PEP_ID=MMETSP0784-20121206/1783_1 /TAXON_ID=39447 /ORGANISM="" /LENGTH=195 /DNA_ID=CAMNT_0005253661 /DNA_START=322 /DNA_END=909 /DNA_ORIENTATION=+